jgi:hypothetical protein
MGVREPFIRIILARLPTVLNSAQNALFLVHLHCADDFEGRSQALPSLIISEAQRPMTSGRSWLPAVSSKQPPQTDVARAGKALVDRIHLRYSANSMFQGSLNYG